MGEKIVLNLKDCRDKNGKPKYPFEEDQHFQILSIKNSIKYIIGGFLSQDKVDDLCSVNGTDVNIK